MQGQDLDAARRAGLGELRIAILEALPVNVVLRFDEECLPELEVHAWWRVRGAEHEAVNSLSFHLSSAMVGTYLRLSPAERADRCCRLRAWVTWALDSGPRVNDGEEGFDVSAVVPMKVFWPEPSRV